MKLFAISLASILFATVSFAQIPITSSSPTPPTPPQPTLDACGAGAVASLDNTNWAFNDIGSNIAQIGTFSTHPGGSITGRRTTNRLGTILERLGDFDGSIVVNCLYGTNTPAAGTLQLGGGIGGQIFSWSFPITATLVNDDYIYTVTSTSTMNLRQYGALDPAGVRTDNTQGYGYAGNTFATRGTAVKITNQLPCPNPADLALDVFAPNGYRTTPNQATPFPDNIALPGSLRFTAAATNRRGGGSVAGNIATPATKLKLPTPYDIGAYQVYAGCTGFVMNIAFIRDGRIVGSNFEGVFAAGDFTRFYILPMEADGPSFTGVKQ